MSAARSLVGFDDGSAVLVGFNDSTLVGLKTGERHFAAVMVDADGSETWRWQV